MSEQMITKTFTISATKGVMKRLENFLGFFHHNGGHSGLFGMYFDGDGSDRMRVDPPPPSYLDDDGFSDRGKIATGQSIEIANESTFESYAIDRTKNHYLIYNHDLYRITPSDEWFKKFNGDWVHVSNPYERER